MRQPTDLARRGTCRSRANDTTCRLKADTTFVDPGPEPRGLATPARITVLPCRSLSATDSPADLAPMLPTAQTAVELHTTYEDRAKGFQIATFPVAVAFGLAALIVGVVGWAVPVLSVTALAVFWVAFLVWWLGGWLIHTLVSPDGIALLQAIMGYRYLRHEQKARLSQAACDRRLRRYTQEDR